MPNFFRSIWNSVAFRLSLVYGALVMASVILFSVTFYFSTVGVLAHSADDKIIAIAERLAKVAGNGNLDHIATKIERELNDGVDSDTEIYLLADASGRKVAGNIPMWKDHLPSINRMIEQNVIRDGRPSVGRMMLRRMPDGALLIVGRDMKDLRAINSLIWRAIGIGILLALLLSVAGTVYIRSLIERKVGTIRRAALDIEAGDLGRRIPASGERDEFSRLSQDLNRMLDKIEHLMAGTRHISNTIAHNLRTPLSRIRGHLEETLRTQPQPEQLIAAGNFAIEEIDGVVVLLEKLLQIAEAESGVRRQIFTPVPLRELVTNLVELYDAVAEDLDVVLTHEIEGNPVILGDMDLLSSAVANLLDNALKYAGSPAVICVHASQHDDIVTLVIDDNGQGIPSHERANVLQPFYRLEHNQHGYGIGLSIVSAIIHLHGGTLHLEDADPGSGLRVRMVFSSPN